MQLLYRFNLIYKSSNLEIFYDPGRMILYCKWIGYQSKENIFKSGAVILEKLQKLRLSKVLNDNTLVVGPWQEASEWTATQWFPAMTNAGLKHFAWILSPDAFAEISARKAVPLSNSQGIQFFSDYHEGLKWLLAQNG